MGNAFRIKHEECWGHCHKILPATEMILLNTSPTVNHLKNAPADPMCFNCIVSGITFQTCQDCAEYVEIGASLFGDRYLATEYIYSTRRCFLCLKYNEKSIKLVYQETILSTTGISSCIIDTIILGYLKNSYYIAHLTINTRKTCFKKQKYSYRNPFCIFPKCYCSQFKIKII